MRGCGKGGSLYLRHGFQGSRAMFQSISIAGCEDDARDEETCPRNQAVAVVLVVTVSPVAADCWYCDCACFGG